MAAIYTACCLAYLASYPLVVLASDLKCSAIQLPMPAFCSVPLVVLKNLAGALVAHWEAKGLDCQPLLASC